MSTLSSKSSYKRRYFCALTAISKPKEEQQTLISMNLNHRLDNLFRAFLKNINTDVYLNNRYFKKTINKKTFNTSSFDYNKKYSAKQEVLDNWKDPDVYRVTARVKNNRYYYGVSMRSYINHMDLENRSKNNKYKIKKLSGEHLWGI